MALKVLLGVIEGELKVIAVRPGVEQLAGGLPDPGVGPVVEQLA